jgi:hypothetical protein
MSEKTTPKPNAPPPKPSPDEEVRSAAQEYLDDQRELQKKLRQMQPPPADPDVADIAPSHPVLTAYDEEHLITYMRLLDADAEGADWREVSRIVLHIDPEHQADRARRAFESHLARAKWMTEASYRHLLRRLG